MMDREMKTLFDAQQLTNMFNQLKGYFGTDNVGEDRRNHITGYVRDHGYLPFSHQRALEELSVAEVLLGLEVKFEQNCIYKDGQFTFTEETMSPVARAGYRDSSWLKKEQLNIKLVNLSALGNANRDETCTGKLQDWLTQILVTPSGNYEYGVLGTVMYVLPFHPREFGCAYIPKSKFVSQALEDVNITNKLGIGLQEQVKMFLACAQLAGHPTMYDVLPQTARYSTTVLSMPMIARWFDVHQLNSQLREALEGIANNMKQYHHPGQVDFVKELVSRGLDGEPYEVPAHDKWLEQEMLKMLEPRKKNLSREMMSRHQQVVISQRVKEIMAHELCVDPNTQLREEDLVERQEALSQKLMSLGLWPAPGGAWNSCGTPVYNKMSEGGAYPLFRHYNIDGEDVTAMANLDCQTPFYFVDLDTGEYNQPVIDYWCDFLVNLATEYDFDAYRVDHVDHIVDEVSQDSQGRPISYRAPACVLRAANDRLRQNKPHFATLAEYMLWEGFLKEYHQDMGFDILWGADIVSQYQKNVGTMIQDNQELANYNRSLPYFGHPTLSILKTYNNQDGEFRDIDQYPGQMEESGALLKWFKLKFTPQHPEAERPVMFIDGDESFTKTGIEKAIGTEVSMRRERNDEFTRRFYALSDFAKQCCYARYGNAEIYLQNEYDEEWNSRGMVSWFIKKQADFGDDERLMIVANENPPRQVIRNVDDNDQLYSEERVYSAVENAEICIPEGFEVVSEFVLPENWLKYDETEEIRNLDGRILRYDRLEPAEFHIYKIKRA